MERTGDQSIVPFHCERVGIQSFVGFSPEGWKQYSLQIQGAIRELPGERAHGADNTVQ